MGCNTSKQQRAPEPSTGSRKARAATVVPAGKAEAAPERVKPAPAAAPPSHAAEKKVEESPVKPASTPEPATSVPPQPKPTEEPVPDASPVKAGLTASPSKLEGSASMTSNRSFRVSHPGTPGAEEEEVAGARLVYEMGLDGTKTAYIRGADGSIKDYPIDDDAKTKLIYEIDSNLDRKAFIGMPDGEMIPYKLEDEETAPAAESTVDGGKFVQMSAADGSTIFMQVNPDGTKKSALLTPDGIRRIFNMMKEEFKIIYEVAASGAKRAVIVNEDGSEKEYEVAMDRGGGNAGFFELAGNAGKKLELIAADGAKIAVESAQNGGRQAYVVAADGSKKIMNSARSATKVMYEVTLDGSKRAYFVAADGARKVYDFGKEALTNKPKVSPSRTVVFDTEKQTGYSLMDGDIIKERATAAAQHASQLATSAAATVKSTDFRSYAYAAGEYARNAWSGHVGTANTQLEDPDLNEDSNTLGNKAHSGAALVVSGLKAAGSSLLDIFKDEKTTTTTIRSTEKVFEEDDDGNMQLVSETTEEKTEGEENNPEKPE